MSGSASNIASIIEIALVFIIIAIIVLGGIVVLVLFKMKKDKQKTEISNEGSDKKNSKSEESARLQGIESMSKFLEFDDIVDNMIVRKKRQQYIMVLQCKGINFDLLSEEEKVAVENGFVQFLNTLRYPVQLYVQTRSLNLREIVDQYKEKVSAIKDDINKIDIQLKREKAAGNTELVKRIEFDRRRKMNVLEYGIDISEYVSRMSQNRNVLQQNTYVVISYYTAEFGGDIANYSKEEVDNIAFSELYTRAQTVIRSLTSAGVTGRVMESEELAELLYVAYNRDDSEVLNLRKSLDAGFNSLYSTAKDVLNKKKEIIEQQVDVAAVEFATENITKADKIRRMKKHHQQEIKRKALDLVESYRTEMDDDLYQETKKQIVENDVISEEKPVRRIPRQTTRVASDGTRTSAPTRARREEANIKESNRVPVNRTRQSVTSREVRTSSINNANELRQTKRVPKRTEMFEKATEEMPRTRKVVQKRPKKTAI